MKSSTVALLLFVLVLIQCTFVESGGWVWGRRRKTSCKYPTSRYGNYGSRSEFFYGTTSLFKGRKRVFQWKLKHSLIMFRGMIFEWGFGSPKTYQMTRNPGTCAISWTWGSKGSSKCYRSDAERWTRNYPRRYGSYKLFTNNCHFFVNRLMQYLKTNCGR